MQIFRRPIYNPTPEGCPDVPNFLTATGITDSTIQAALATFATNFELGNLCGKVDAIYPFVGGIANAHKYNLLDPRDADDAFRITWNGTVTHNANGITGNGSTGYGNTHLIPSNVLTNNDIHLSVYVRTSTAETASKVEIGSGLDSTHDLALGTRWDGYFIGVNCTNDANRVLVDTGNAQGFGVISRRSSTELEGYRNGSSIQTKTAAHTGDLNVFPIFISAENDNGTPQRFSDRNIAFASIGKGLTDTEVTNLYNAVQTLQTALSRQI